MDHIALENLKAQTIKAFVTLDTELSRVRKEMAELAAPEVKKTFTAEHITQKKASILARAKEIGALQRAEAMNLANRLNVTKDTWSTPTLLKRARFFPAGEKIENEIAEELRRLRLSADLRDCTAQELVEMAQDAKQTANLALLAMVSKESQRRMFESDSEKALVRVEVGKAISEVKIPDQEKAHALIEETERTLEAVEDCVSELLTGQEPKRAEMRRMMARRQDDDGE